MRETRFNSIPTLNESNLKINNLHRNSDLYLLFIRSIPFHSFVRLFVARSRKINCEPHCATVKAMNIWHFAVVVVFTDTNVRSHAHARAIDTEIYRLVLRRNNSREFSCSRREPSSSFPFWADGFLSYYIVFLCQLLSLCVFCHIDDTDTMLLLCRLRFV